eukprot:5295969-Pyramimonas_sp.AAC.3
MAQLISCLPCGCEASCSITQYVSSRQLSPLIGRVDTIFRLVPVKHVYYYGSHEAMRLSCRTLKRRSRRTIRIQP